MEEMKQKPVKMMTCPYCKQEIIKGSKICPHCRGKIKSKFRRFVVPAIVLVLVVGMYHSCRQSMSEQERHSALLEIKSLSYSLVSARSDGMEMESGLRQIERMSAEAIKKIDKEHLDTIDRGGAGLSALQKQKPQFVNDICAARLVNDSAKRGIELLEKNGDLMGAIDQLNYINNSIKSGK
ncbi:MAG: hypothetical protein MJ025_02185 [Victivallaceae bacterium]|nr:hypothetical protein [Victivallaceae bacterium]